MKQFYEITNDCVYYLGKGYKEIIPNSDVSSFHELNQSYGKDNQNVFFQSYLIEGADPESFRGLGVNLCSSQWFS